LAFLLQEMKNELCETLVFRRKKNCFIVSLRFHLWPALIPRHLIYGIGNVAIISSSFYFSSLLITNFRFWPQFFCLLDCRFYWFFFRPFFFKFFDFFVGSVRRAESNFWLPRRFKFRAQPAGWAWRQVHWKGGHLGIICWVPGTNRLMLPVIFIDLEFFFIHLL